MLHLHMENIKLAMQINDLAKEMAKEPTAKPIQPDFIIILGTDADQTQSGVANTAQ